MFMRRFRPDLGLSGQGREMVPRPASRSEMDVQEKLVKRIVV
jgi:hypothetical protein